MKLSNFLAIDTTYRGKGMKGFSKNDNEVFLEFNNNRGALSNIANKIRATLKYDYLVKNLNLIEDEADDNHIAKEGKVLYKLHKYRERNKKLVEKKKANHKNKYENISCEKCGFDFERVYGILGRDFIECHHITPLFKLEVESEIKLDDLKLLCSNCHRMEHRKLKQNNI